MAPTPDSRAHPELNLTALHERHPGISAEVAAVYAQAAAVCLTRHHASPVEISVSKDLEPEVGYPIAWPTPTDRVRAAWANVDDATRDAAYGIILAAAEAHLGLVALERAYIGSGADYWIMPGGTAESPSMTGTSIAMERSSWKSRGSTAVRMRPRSSGVRVRSFARFREQIRVNWSLPAW